MSEKLWSPHEIERWNPPSLRHVVGCSELKEHFANMLRVDGYGPNTLITGGSQTGKTAIVRAYLRTLMCPNRNLVTLDICGQCQSCMQFDPRQPNAGLKAIPSASAEAGCAPIHYLPVNCSTISEDEWEDILQAITEWGDLTVVHLDEFHYLQDEGLMDKAIHLLSDSNALWIATAPSVNSFDQRVLGHFSAVLSTSPASTEEFVQFLQDRCTEWGLTARDPESLILLAEHSKAMARAAINFLAVAAGKESRAFDGTDVETYFRRREEQVT